ncbi:MAG: endonuclease/exonuclease/phosphatase family protein [Bacteroidales bacterium]|nr:endonuclease/exonuclease/phosphatase family protein [Bacteroidales bacterium]
MQKTLIALSFLALCALPCAGRRPERVRIGTYNLRRAPLDEKSAENKWTVREPRLIQSILDCNFDICGLQEVDLPEQESIPLAIAEKGVKYDSYFFGPYEEDGHGSRAHGLIWRSDRFRLVDGPHRFWVSDPPEKMQVNDRGSNKRGEFMRGGSCVILKDRKAGKKYFVMVTHAPLNRVQHAENAHVYIDMEKKFNPRCLPSFFLGDLNVYETEAASALYRSYWTDGYHAFDTDPGLRDGPEITFNGWKKEYDPSLQSRIDYVYFKGQGVTPLHYTCNDTLYGGLLASDHYPVYIDFEIR